MLERSIDQLNWARQQFERVVVKAKEALDDGNLLSTVVWAEIGANFAYVRHPGFYTSRVLESLLVEVARRLDKPTPTLSKGPWPRSRHSDSGKTHVLHVLTEACERGGHTRVLEGWIGNTADSAKHSLVTTAQLDPLPERLASSIVGTGGWFQSLATSSSNLLDRSVLLRQVAKNWADVVVLHIHPYDASPIVAFGVEGGPPVVLFNHADHVFWLGASVADVVADICPLGQRITLTRRGILNSRILPIPLLNPKPGPSHEEAMRRFHIENDMVVLLTIGSECKYAPFAGYDFVDNIVGILRRNPKATLLAVGPTHQGRWAKASGLVDGRIRAVGVQTDLELLYACADIYLPGFPLAGLTAMLGAGARGVAIIGLRIPESPKLCGADDIALDKLDTHASSLEEYTALVERLITEPTSRIQKGAQTKEQIKTTHLPPGWNGFLEDVMLSLPTEHCVSLPSVSNPSIDSSDVFLAGLDAALSFSESMPIFNRLMLDHGSHFPAQERVRNLLEVLKKTSGTQMLKMSILEGASIARTLLPPQLKLAMKSNTQVNRMPAKISEALRPHARKMS